MNAIQRAVEIMQDLEERRSVEEVAAMVGLSPIAFSRLFAAIEGMGPLAYMRRLRLERAAEQLVTAPGTPLVDVAFDAGFESQQTFTRAFTAMFGVPPGVFRKTTTTRRQTMTISIEPKFDDHRIMNLPARRYAGFGVTIDGNGKQHPGQAWEKLMPMLPFSGQVPGKSFGICTAETAEGSHGYMAAVELEDGAPIPEGLEQIDLAAAKYFVVRQWMPADGFGDHLRAGLERLWGGLITSHGHEPSGEPDLEVYEDDFYAGQTDGWLTYMVPIKG